MYRGIILEDLQLREVPLDATLQAAVTAKVAAQQDAERQQFELSKATQQAEITRVNAIATADAQQILACGGSVQTTEVNSEQVVTVLPNSIDECSEAQLTLGLSAGDLHPGTGQLAQQQHHHPALRPEPDPAHRNPRGRVGHRGGAARHTAFGVGGDDQHDQHHDHHPLILW